jgi:anthranilate synthase component 1
LLFQQAGFFISPTFKKKLIMSYHFHVRLRSMPADTLTPVSAYLRLRDRFPNALLLESSGYNGNENSYSYICCKPVAGLQLQQGVITQQLPGNAITSCRPGPGQVLDELSSRLRTFSFAPTGKACCDGRFFGHINYDAVTCFEDIQLRERENSLSLPDIRLHIYRYIIIFDHFNHTVYLAVQTMVEGEQPDFETLEAALRRPQHVTFPFDTVGAEQADTTEEEYQEMVRAGIQHCMQGDVFQVVLSRSFSQRFKGDDFNVYRALRMVNPSPYLFYFDYGNYRLFGSSPETQLKVNHEGTVMYPIAGTCRRSGNEEEDEQRIRQLLTDPKENAEHIMLVDLARNDLAKSHDQVAVTSFRQVQRFAHVAHIVSEVTATLPLHKDPLQLIADTFPAGTLSGAPKYKAMQLIDRYEPTRRGYYGGSIGFLSPDGSLNQAIMIRSFMSSGHTLYYRAGAGIVASSSATGELQEVAHKLRGLRLAIARAKEISIPLPVMPL